MLLLAKCEHYKVGPALRTGVPKRRGSPLANKRQRKRFVNFFSTQAAYACRRPLCAHRRWFPSATQAPIASRVLDPRGAPEHELHLSEWRPLRREHASCVTPQAWHRRAPLGLMKRFDRERLDRSFQQNNAPAWHPGPVQSLARIVTNMATIHLRRTLCSMPRQCWLPIPTRTRTRCEHLAASASHSRS